MHRVGIKPSQIHEYMVEWAGGYRQVGYTRSDIRNSLACLRRKKFQNTDAESYIAYLQGKQSNNEAFYFKYTIDNENRLGDIFWCDGSSRADYEHFGDAMLLMKHIGRMLMINHSSSSLALTITGAKQYSDLLYFLRRQNILIHGCWRHY